MRYVERVVEIGHGWRHHRNLEVRMIAGYRADLDPRRG